MARVLFCQLSSYELNSFQILSAVLKKAGHETDVFSLAFDSFQKLYQLIESWQPDIIGFTVTSMDYKKALDVAKELKRCAPKKIHISIGGPHAIISPKDLIVHPHVDSVCVCEGEYILMELADALDSNGNIDGIQGLWTRQYGTINQSPPRALIKDMGELPLDDKDLYFKRYPLLAQSPFKIFTVSRGCPYRCAYCTNHHFRKLLPGKHLRYRPVQQVIQEIKNVQREYPLKYVMFRSDTFTAQRRWCHELLKEYKDKIHLPFYAQTVLNTLSESLVDALSDAGMAHLIFAIESGNERIRQDILRRPKITNERMLELAQLVRNKGIKITTQEMFALPTETLDDAFLTLELNIKMRARMTATILHPYANTDITKHYDDPTINVDNLSHFAGETILKGKDVPRIVTLQRFCGWLAILPWNIYKPLKPVIRALTRIPDNFIFRFFSNLNYFFVQKRMTNKSCSFLFFLRYGYFARKSFD